MHMTSEKLFWSYWARFGDHPFKLEMCNDDWHSSGAGVTRTNREMYFLHFVAGQVFFNAGHSPNPRLEKQRKRTACWEDLAQLHSTRP